MKLGFTREEHREEAAFPGGDPPPQLIELFNADTQKNKCPSALALCSLCFGFRNLYQCELLSVTPTHCWLVAFFQVEEGKAR